MQPTVQNYIPTIPIEVTVRVNPYDAAILSLFLFAAILVALLAYGKVFR